MFTGIIEEIGTIEGRKGSTFKVRTKSILKEKQKGQSIAVNGACMTITKIGDKTFEFEVMSESLEKTNLGTIKKNDKVNLESALKFGKEIDGHLVLGHIDEMGTVEKIEKNRLTIRTPRALKKFITYKGSISINGVSLTISRAEKTTFSVDLIPLTLKITNLGLLKKDDKVNLEIDMIARYLEKLCK